MFRKAIEVDQTYRERSSKTKKNVGELFEKAFRTTYVIRKRFPYNGDKLGEQSRYFCGIARKLIRPRGSGVPTILPPGISAPTEVATGEVTTTAPATLASYGSPSQRQELFERRRRGPFGDTRITTGRNGIVPRAFQGRKQLGARAGRNSSSTRRKDAQEKHCEGLVRKGVSDDIFNHTRKGG